MANQKISELTALGAAPATNDLLPLRDTDVSATKSMTVANLFTSPSLTTPALGTPVSGVMTNVTGIPVGALANGTDGQLITWGADAVATTEATGSATQVLTSNGAGAAPTFQAAVATTEPFVTIGNTAGLSAERALTGTANQITVTDGGADGAATLSTPQNIHTAATPQFSRLGLGSAADGVASLILNNSIINDTYYYLHNSCQSLDGSTSTIDSTGTVSAVQKIK